MRNGHCDHQSVFIWGLVLTLCALLFAPPAVLTHAQTVTTSITSSGLGTNVSTSGTTTTITGGTRPNNGGNLFHSFGNFSVGTGDTANFSNNTGLPTTNILSRVTGGSVSNIFGKLQTSGFGSAALWLINPAGVVFGPSASLNVGGAVHISTADYLRMFDGVTSSYFYASLNKNSTLSSAPVTAFGFLGTNPGGTITIQGGTVNNASTLSLVGRDLVNSRGGTTAPGIIITGGKLSNSGGSINLVSVKTPQDAVAGGEILTEDLSPSSSNGFSTLGTVQLDPGTTVTSGSTMVRADNLVMEHALIDSRSGGGVDIHATNVKLIGGAQTFAPLISPFGDPLECGACGFDPAVVTIYGGKITINSVNVTLDQAVLRNEGGGDIRIQGITGSNSLASQVVLNNSTLQAFGARLVGIRAEQMTLAGSTFRNIQRGPGGEVNLYGGNAIVSQGNNAISTTAFEDGGGSINLMSAGRVELRTGDQILSTNTCCPAPPVAGRIFGAGAITISAPVIDIRGTVVSAGASNFVTGGAIKVLGNSVYIANSTLSTNALGKALGSGVAGDILIAGSDSASKAQTIELVNSGLRSSATCLSFCEFFKFGDSGTVTLKGLTTTLDGTEVSVTNSLLGKSGRIIVDSGEFRMLNGATLTSSTSGLGVGAAPGGDIAVTAAGTIDIRTGSSILASSSGDGNAGGITLTAGHDIQLRQSAITTSTTGEQSSGGKIKLTAPDTVLLDNSLVTSSVKGSKGSDGGNITIDPQLVVLRNGSEILAQANEGAGGIISISAMGAVLAEAGTLISASAGPAGINGSVNIQAPIQQLSGAIAPLPQAFANIANLYGQHCAAQKGGQFSSFVQGARDGLPPQPGEVMGSPLTFEPLRSSISGLQNSALAAVRLGLDYELGDKGKAFSIVSGCRS